ncbi:putative transporter MCH4 [Colletotrichum viniferum]|nr:putative transporter MCH4 [Colletotrichum viniferum]
MSSPSAQNNSDLGTAREGASTNFELESGQRGPPSGAPNPRNTRSADIENRISSWVCVLGAFIFLLPSYGLPQAIGTFQAYLQEHQLSGYSARDIGWVTGLYTALTLFLGIQAGPIVDRYGTEVLAPLSTALTLSTFFLLAECKYYWQFMLCLGIYGGIGGGIGGGLASTAAVSVVGKIFTRLRGLAIGLALTGSALGGVIFPFLLRELFPKWGWAWSMRFVGFTIASVMIPGTLCFIPFAKLS